MRFKADIVVLAPTRWKLRRGVRLVNAVLASLALETHPDKTFIGCIERGFDSLGYRFAPAGLAPARASIEHFVERGTWL